MAMIKEGKETYTFKGAMKKHEGKESKKVESKESTKGMHKMPDGKMMKNSGMNMGGMVKKPMGYAKGGMVKGKKC